MIQLILEATKPIAEATVKSSNDTLEILSKINEFYDSSWNKLLYVLSGAFGVLAFVVPAVINYYQKKSILLSEQKLENNINQGIEAAKQEIKDAMLEELRKKTAEFEEKVELTNRKSEAQVFHLQANGFIDKNNFYEALIGHIRASEMHLKVDDLLNLKTSLEAISYCLTKLNKEDLKRAKNADSTDLGEVLKQIKNREDTGILFKEIQEIKTRLHKIHNP